MTDPGNPAKRGVEKDDGLGKYMKRVKTVLKGRNRASVSSMTDIFGESSKSGAKAAATSSSSKPAATTVLKSTTAEAVHVHLWSTLQQEKARALFAKYGLTLDPSEWMSKPVDICVQRVEKPVRMRVRRNCHRCLTTFGANRVCIGCQHVRCTKCFRYPPAKAKEDEREKEKAKSAAAAAAAAEASKKIVLTIPSRTGGQDLVHKPIRQRIRRTCHCCETLFIGEATECEKCKHIRCKKCPRDPPKLHKYPDGYPGDAEPPVVPLERVWRKPKRRVRWTCHNCSKLFKNGDKICSHCQHDRCKDCIRDPPKKIKPEPDPEILRRVEERLSKVLIS
ncbi:uncharacterized protein PADG_05485 [Paracoccidioides brasiliensis Pb18]|uniref:Uncharacterized protein n=1 Tax=Paracoccidioides brasiliensis (strain Pb18) TaxID=502780 RepID=C1GDZ9_PARBD|nr:uncharacterized protein PADG_05485 [Paracoccidioides brasiliensis Pb18]EEH49406.2 hypothetical protein PADG_05485 [Paracoccidioides brasiliensis Pb18]